MQVVGYKEYYYGGIGYAAVFYSNLWHWTGEAAPGTMKVDIFCENVQVSRIENKQLVKNTYPYWIIYKFQFHFTANEI